MLIANASIKAQLLLHISGASCRCVRHNAGQLELLLGQLIQVQLHQRHVLSIHLDSQMLKACAVSRGPRLHLGVDSRAELLDDLEVRELFLLPLHGLLFVRIVVCRVGDGDHVLQ